MEEINCNMFGLLSQTYITIKIYIILLQNAIAYYYTF